MQDLVQQERFELEVLDKLNSKRLLSDLVFGGETMLRLCFGLHRFSADLDFRMVKDREQDALFRRIRECLAEAYQVVDAANKFYTLLFEIKSPAYPRSLKIEIGKEAKKIRTETAIAYSKHSNTQVMVRVVSLDDMMRAKVEAFLERKEIRDAFDIEFMLIKGVNLDVTNQAAMRLRKGIEALTKNDYAAKLGPLLEAKQRSYYLSNNFKILKSRLYK